MGGGTGMGRRTEGEMGGRTEGEMGGRTEGETGASMTKDD